jgi:hypothetical protein
MKRPKQEKSEARWRDYAADHYFHHYYRYGEDEAGNPLEGHDSDDLLELSAEAVKNLTAYKHYEGGRTLSSVAEETGFTFARRRRNCCCVPAQGTSCCHRSWTGDEDKGVVMPARPARAGGGGAAQRVTRQAARRSGPSPAFRKSIDDSSLLCMPGDEDDEAADGEDVWFVNARGPQEQNTVTRQCGPCTLIKNHYSIPVRGSRPKPAP